MAQTIAFVVCVLHLATRKRRDNVPVVFDLLEDRIRPRLEPRRWHSWMAAFMSLATLAGLAEFAFHRAGWITSGGASGYALLAFACADAAIVLVTWARFLAGQVQADRAYSTALLCWLVMWTVDLFVR